MTTRFTGGNVPTVPSCWDPKIVAFSYAHLQHKHTPPHLWSFMWVCVQSTNITSCLSLLTSAVCVFRRSVLRHKNVANCRWATYDTHQRLPAATRGLSLGHPLWPAIAPCGPGMTCRCSLTTKEPCWIGIIEDCKDIIEQGCLLNRLVPNRFINDLQSPWGSNQGAILVCSLNVT